MWYNIFLLAVGAVFAIFGGIVVLRPAKFTNKKSEDFDAAVKKTKRYGLMMLCLSVGAFLLGIGL